MKQDNANAIPVKLSPKQLDEVSAELAHVTLERLKEEQTAKDEAAARRKIIKELKKRQTTLANEKESGMRLEDRQGQLFDGDDPPDDEHADDDIPPPAPAAPTKKPRKPRG